MASLLVPVRIATIVLTGLCVVLSIVNLIQVLDHSRDTTAITSLAITIGVAFLGAWGAYKNERTYLMTFALIMVIAIIVGFVGNTGIYTSLGFSLLVVVLALVQAELLRRGH